MVKTHEEMTALLRGALRRSRRSGSAVFVVEVPEAEDGRVETEVCALYADPGQYLNLALAALERFDLKLSAEETTPRVVQLRCKVSAALAVLSDVGPGQVLHG